MNRNSRLVPGLVLLSIIMGPAAVQSKVLIRYMTSISPGPEGETLTKVVMAFQARYPDTKVEVIYAPQAGYLLRYLQLCRDGKAPDVVSIDSQDAWKLVDNLLVEDLNRYLGDGKRVVDSMVREYVTAFTHKGSLAAVPLHYNVPAMAYNAALFQDAGLLTPRQFSKSGLWNYASFLSVARKLTRHKAGEPNGKADLWGYAGDASWSWDYWVYGSGGSLLSPDYTRCTLDSEEAIKGLQFQSDLTYRYKVTPTAGYFVDDFAHGKVGMVLGTSAMYPKWKAVGSSLRWGLAQFPSDRRTYVRMSSQGVAMSRQSHRKLYAWDFMRFLASSEAQKLFISGNPWAVPSNVQVAKSEAFLGPKLSDIQETLVDQSSLADSKRSPFGKPLPDIFHPTLTLELAQYWATKESAENAAARLVPQLNKILDDWNRKRARKQRSVNP